jgi:hypothetical protein
MDAVPEFPPTARFAKLAMRTSLDESFSAVFAVSILSTLFDFLPLFHPYHLPWYKIAPLVIFFAYNPLHGTTGI